MEWPVNLLGEPEWRAGSRHGRQLMLTAPQVLSMAAGGRESHGGRGAQKKTRLSTDSDWG